MIALVQRRVDEVEVTLRQIWQGVGDKTALVGTFAAEHMRALIYGAACAHRGAGVAGGIHTARILASARRAVELLWPLYAHRPPVPDICATTLEQMKIIGDAVHVGQGQWLATPLRLVALKDSSSYLLVGTAPAQITHHRLGTTPTCAGTSRFISGAESGVQEIGELVVSADGWFGHHQPLAAWTAQVLSHHEGRMETVEVPSGNLEIYAPDVSQVQRRSGRWVAAGQIGRSLEGPRLCRPQAGHANDWDRPYYLAHFGFKGGMLTLRRAVPISQNLTLRLRFGFDIVLQSPRRILIVRQRDSFWIDRPLMLPQPESRVYALGWKHDGQDHLDRLTFHADAMPLVVHALQRLAVTPSITSGGTG